AVKFSISEPGEKIEHIYVCRMYSWDELFLPETEDMLQRIGAKRTNGLWSYRDAAKSTTYYIHLVTSRTGMELALKEAGSHVIVGGHSNFGTGPVFADSTELQRQEITDLYYVDDDHFLNISSPMTSLKIDGMQFGQAFPNWRPIYKDGTSAMMPYTFEEGMPPYNYYVTYKLPGDPNAYKVELANGSNLERFSDSGVPAWYSPTGTPPDPNLNPEYFIINPDPDYCRCDFVGNWSYYKVGSDFLGDAGYFGYNDQYRSAGSGVNTAKFHFFVPNAGSYQAKASWHATPANASNATYAIEHADGVSTVVADQRITTNEWNVLGTYNFNRGSYDITLSDNADGTVIADAAILVPMDNPSTVLNAEFTTSVLSGSAPLSVKFTDRSIAMKGTKSRLWDFGDGTTSADSSPLHLYLSPGIYTVSLTLTDNANAQDTETKTSLIEVGMTAPLTACFAAQKLSGAGRTAIKFNNYSKGVITNYLWNFGDGTTSTLASPLHAYTNIGVYTVSLTVSGPGGSSTETETNYVYILKPNVYVDNTMHDKTHFVTGGSRPFGKVVLDTRVSKLKTGDLKYKRLFYGSCNSANYFLDVLQHGLVFCTSGDTYHYAGITYLEDYLKGYSDADILVDINKIDNVFEIIDFTKKPPSLR
ncbi:MAG: PKD domain-containing protein, partial [Sedimentisphaerales bacterium]|nr:PKD domain-containing protein [Sedimentisphaerales bacterium]